MSRTPSLSSCRDYHLAPVRTERRHDHSVLKVTQVGNSLGVVLPREILAELNVEKGDKLFLTRSPDGYRTTRSDPAFDEQMAVAREDHEAAPQRPARTREVTRGRTSSS